MEIGFNRCINRILGFINYLQAASFFQSISLMFFHLLSCQSFQLSNIFVLIILKRQNMESILSFAFFKNEMNEALIPIEMMCTATFGNNVATTINFNKGFLIMKVQRGNMIRKYDYQRAKRLLV